MLWTKMCLAHLHIISHHKGHFLGWNWTVINHFLEEETEETLAELGTDSKEIKHT